jgi:glutathione peroxidase
MTINNFKAAASDGTIIPLKKYNGKVLLVVNTASKCGFTPQFDELQNLYSELNDKGLEILAFPCNQFLKQDPGTNDEIASFCRLNFGVTFPVFAKVDVNGPAADPIFQYLKSGAKGLFGSQKIKWNFTKFLIDRSGNVVKRYAPIVKPGKLKDDILKLM